MAISVCMATYNGAEFLGAQLESILRQLSPDDEIVIVDDCSRDATVEVAQAFGDPRIKIFRNASNLGSCKSFAKAIRLTGRDLIFFADQDDTWVPGRRGLMERAFESGALLVSSNQRQVDREGRDVPLKLPLLRASDSRRHWSNIGGVLLGRASYFGCCMAISTKFKEVVLPIPSYVEAHDLWVALAANMIGSNLHLDDVTLNRLIHGKNASETKRSIIRKFRTRIIHLRSMLELRRRILAKR